MEPKSSLPHLQLPATCPYPVSDQSCPCPHLASWRSILILYFYLRLSLSSVRLPSGPQVADERTASNIEGICEYIELAVADSRQGIVLQLGVWARC
jgi:hypothetical protein